MFKKLFYFFISSILFLTVLSAQKVDRTGGFTRIASMGATPYIMDPYIATVNPAWSGYYADYVFADIGLPTGAVFGPGGIGQFFAGSFSLGKNLTIGGILSRSDFLGIGISSLDPGRYATNFLGLPGGLPALSVVGTVNGLVGAPQAPAFDTNLELMATFGNKTTTFGFGVAYAKRSTEAVPAPVPAPGVTPPTAESSSSQIGFNVGILQKFTSKFLIDAGVSVILPSASSTAGVQNYSETKASQTFIMVNARAFYEYSKNVTFVPIFTFVTASGSIDTGGVPNAAGVTRGSGDMPSITAFSFGLGVNYQVGDFLMSCGPSLWMASITTQAISGVSPETKQSAFIFPLWNIGLEWKMLNWLVGRMGYSVVTGSVTTQTPANANDVAEATNPLFTPANRGITLGVGFRFGDFSLDAYVNEDVLRQGFGVISGGGNNNRSFAYLSAGYALP